MGSKPNDVIEFYQFTNPSCHTRPWGLLRNIKKIFLGSTAWPVHEADKLTAICEPIF
jgi:hypothetical protein